MHPSSWWRTAAIAFVLLAVCLSFAARILVGPRGGEVHVRWQPSIAESSRLALEGRFRLADGQRLDEQTWRYDLIDPSRENIGALLVEPAVADTHNIDRPNRALDPSAIRTARRQRFPSAGEDLVAIADWLAIAMIALAGVVVGLGVSGRAPTPGAIPALIVGAVRTGGRLATGGLPPSRLRPRRSLGGGEEPSGYQTALAPVTRFLQRGIPEIDARTAGLFRIVFGVAVVLFFASHPVNSGWLSATFDLEVDGPLHAAVLDWLRGRPWIVDLVMPWLMTTGVAFTAGLFTRVTYSLFVAGVLVWAYVAASLASTHPQSILVLALVALLPSRWGDALSVDSWLRLTRGRESRARPAGKRYGYSVWVPGLAFGVALAAAAWAKLSVPPGWTSWVLNGTVKYHFISDSVNAPVDWGLQLARHPLLAVLASFGAVATEALVVSAAFTRNEWYRLAMGAAALALLIGFELFMGVFWPGWWVPLLAFLPWERLGRLKPAPTGVRDRNGRPVANSTHGTNSTNATNSTHTTNSTNVTNSTYVGAGFSRPEGRGLTTAQLIVVAAVIAQQAVVSALRLDRAPMFSWYDMYSGSYSSLAAFNASRPPRFRIVATTDRGRAELRCNPHEEFVREFQSAVDGSPGARAGVWLALRGCGDLAGVRQVMLEGDLSTFDGDRLEFTSAPTAIVLGPLAPDEGGGAGDAP